MAGVTLVGGASGASADVASNTRALFVNLKPDDYNGLGIYSLAGTSGIISSALAANAPIFSFRYGGANTALIRRIMFSSGNTATAFTAGVFSFQAFIARSFSGSDTGGTAITPTSNTSKLRTANMVTTAISDARIASTAALTPGTRTLDGQPFAAVSGSIPAVAGTNMFAPWYLWDAYAGDYPLALANNEGFVLQATMPGTGTWTFSIGVLWAEVTSWY